MSLHQHGWVVTCDHPGCDASTPPQATSADARAAWHAAGGVTQLPGLWPVDGRTEPVALMRFDLCRDHTVPHDAPRPAWMAKAGRR